MKGGGGSGAVEAARIQAEALQAQMEQELRIWEEQKALDEKRRKEEELKQERETIKIELEEKLAKEQLAEQTEFTEEELATQNVVSEAKKRDIAGNLKPLAPKGNTFSDSLGEVDTAADVYSLGNFGKAGDK